MQLHALIVDDSAVMRKMIARTLGQTSYKPKTILEAGDGEEGFQTLIKNPDVNVIFSDWNMPKMDGAAFVKLARQHNKNLIIIMITTEGTEQKFAEVQGVVDSYIVKPFTPEAMQEKLEKAIGKLTL